MRIKKIKLVGERGCAGLHVEHLTTINKGKDSYDVHRKDKYTHPTTEKLNEALDMLKIHLMKICHLWMPEWDAFIDSQKWSLVTPQKLSDTFKVLKVRFDKLEITGVTSNLEDLLIVGKTVVEGNGNFNIVSPNIKPGMDYEHYDAVISIIANIYEHVENYITGVDSVAPKAELKEERKENVDISEQKAIEIPVDKASDNGGEELSMVGVPEEPVMSDKPFIDL